jgi:4-hydroxybenzoate polyprenyltransferase
MDFKTFSKLVILERTLFTLPFAYLGVLFAGKADLRTWILVTIALTAARTAGMSFNRVIDVEIDTRNPRTKHRLVPSGEVSRFSVWLTGIISCIILILCSYLLNPLCFHLSFLAVFMLVTYSYLKRFSASSHFYLGLTEAAAPIGGYLAVTGDFSIIPFLLGAVITLWIAGLDIIYAMQDTEIDKEQKLHSVPVELGRNSALILSVICYTLSMTAMVVAGCLTGKPLFYWLAVIAVGGLFFYQQFHVWTKKIEEALGPFFKANLYISPVLFIGTLLDELVLKLLEKWNYMPK